ncbi:DsbA family protein [Streptomyces sp. NPDC056682]|uniref:DsbA family protein n=1 Tax=Streptomyces sp. NPDC056682 TaxID=3345909 RepID=UPI0036CA210C
MSAEVRVQLSYAFDAYCPWCYGFGPALRSFAEDNAHRIRLRVLSVGLYAGVRVRPVSAYPQLPGQCGRVSAVTGVGFGAGFQRAVSQGTAVLDSAAAAAGLAALRAQPGVLPLNAAEAVQRVWFADGGSLSDVEVYRDIADGMSLDADAVTRAYASCGSRAQADADFRAVRRLRVTSYPTLLHAPLGTGQLGGAASTAAALTASLDQYLATASS